MLQPVTICAVAVSSAAPTLNPEYRARASSRASTAAATSAVVGVERRGRRRAGPAARPLRCGGPRRSSARRRRRVVLAGRSASGARRSSPLRRSPLPRWRSRHAPSRFDRQSRPMMPSSSAANAPRTRRATSITSSWFERLRQHAGGGVGDARDAEHLEPMCRATIASGTVDMPTASAPMVRKNGSRRASRSSGRAPRRRRRGRRAAPARARPRRPGRAGASSRPRSCPGNARPNGLRWGRRGDCCRAG